METIDFQFFFSFRVFFAPIGPFLALLDPYWSPIAPKKSLGGPNCLQNDPCRLPQEYTILLLLEYSQK